MAFKTSQTLHERSLWDYLFDASDDVLSDDPIQGASDGASHPR
jgi:hypothetical protein